VTEDEYIIAIVKDILWCTVVLWVGWQLGWISGL